MIPGTMGDPSSASNRSVRLPVLILTVIVAAGAAVALLRGDESKPPATEPVSAVSSRATPRGQAPRVASPRTPAPAVEEPPALDLSRPPDSPPPSFASRVSEKEWYEQRLQSARRDLRSQLAARERMPALREKAEQAVHPDVNLREWEAASERLERNIARSEYKIEWYEAKLAEMAAEP